jgi:hypothetical protein
LRDFHECEEAFGATPEGAPAMNRFAGVEATANVLRVRAAAWVRGALNELQMEWHSLPLIRHLSALALCLLVVLVGVVETSMNRALVATKMSGTGHAVATRPAPGRVEAVQASTRGVRVAEGRQATLSRTEAPTTRR